MGRKTRLEYEGGIYHVIGRGNNRESIFKHDALKAYLINLLYEYKVPMKYKIIGYTFMDNHYHFILQTNDKPLQKIMHCINNRYSKYYNWTYSRTGHVMERRYKSIPVQDESYLLVLLRYVHNNPVRAGMCSHMSEYARKPHWCLAPSYHVKVQSPRHTFYCSSMTLLTVTSSEDTTEM